MEFYVSDIESRPGRAVHSQAHERPSCRAVVLYTSFATSLRFLFMMAGRTPEWAKTLVLKKCSTEAKPVYHDIVLEKHPLQQLKYGEVLVKINAASFNRREVCMRHCEGSLLIQRHG